MATTLVHVARAGNRVAGGALATASPAAATQLPPPGGGSWDHTWTTTDAKAGGTVYVEEHGDLIYLCDTAADGVAPRARIYAWNTTDGYLLRYSLTASGGNGSCAHGQASDGGAFDLPENDNINIDLFLGPYPGTNRTQPTFLNDH